MAGAFTAQAGRGTSGFTYARQTRRRIALWIGSWSPDLASELISWDCGPGDCFSEAQIF